MTATSARHVRKCIQQKTTQQNESYIPATALQNLVSILLFNCYLHVACKKMLVPKSTQVFLSWTLELFRGFPKLYLCGLADPAGRQKLACLFKWCFLRSSTFPPFAILFDLPLFFPLMPSSPLSMPFFPVNLLFFLLDVSETLPSGRLRFLSFPNMLGTLELFPLFEAICTRLPLFSLQ